MNSSNKKKKVILQLVIKNTSELDYSIPLLWKISKNDDYKVFVLYCNLNKSQFLRQSSYYSNLLESWSILEYDFFDFSNFILLPLVPIFRKLLAKPYSDRSPGEIFKSIYNLPPHKWFLGIPAWLFFKTCWAFCIKKLELFLQSLIPVDRILKTINPDLILFGNRTKTDFKNREKLFSFFYQKKVPVILLPHGTHEVHPYKEFIPFDEQGESLPEFCEFWSSMKFETPWEILPEKKHLFQVVGYPGLDDEWVQFLKKQNVEKKNSNKKYNVVTVLRKYLPEGVIKPKDYDPFTLQYDEVLNFLSNVQKAVEEIKDNHFEFIFKPHPSNNFTSLKEIIKRAGIKSFKISDGPIYELLPETDLVVSIFSTVLLVPVIHNIPVITVNTPLQNYVHNRWDKLKDLYSGLTYFTENNPTSIGVAIKDIIHKPNKNTIEHDKHHVLDFYGSFSLNMALDRIDKLSKKGRNFENNK